MRRSTRLKGFRINYDVLHSTGAIRYIMDEPNSIDRTENLVAIRFMPLPKLFRWEADVININSLNRTCAKLFNYHFYHFATSYNSIVLSNKRACHMIFFDSLFTTKKKEKKKLSRSIIFVSYCSSKSENLIEFRPR